MGGERPAKELEGESSRRFVPDVFLQGQDWTHDERSH
jgi:hypothetical protein